VAEGVSHVANPVEARGMTVESTREAFLFEPDFSRGEWREVLLAYLEAFAHDEAVALVFPLDPGRPGALAQERAGERVMEVVAGFGEEPIPEVILVDGSAELLGTLRGFSKVHWAPAPGDPGDAPPGSLPARFAHARRRRAASSRRAPAAAAPALQPAAPPDGLFAAHELPAVIQRMAQTGAGTDACLELGCLPMQVHFYSPVPDIQDLDRRDVWSRRSSLAGIDFREEEQVAYLLELGRAHGEECLWPSAPTGDPHQFHLNNDSFSFGCAAGLHTILRHHRPARVIEIGSGQSSRVISAALGRNAAEGAPAEYTVIDPYPADSMRSLPGLTRLIPERVELSAPGLFEELQANDVLFIDSSHTVKTGGDVNFLFLDVLPRLRPGVIVHVHDIALPYEYTRTYFTNPAFRVFWTEAYLLQAFLTCNDQFEVRLAMAYLQTERSPDFQAAFPHYDPLKHAGSGSFWIRRKASA